MSRRTGNRFFLPLAALAALLALTAAPALAQNVPDSWEITGFGGGYFGGQIFESFDGAVDVSSAVTYGARLGYNFNRAIGVEVGWSQAKPNLNAGTYFHGDPMGFSGKIGTLCVNTYEADVLFSFGSRRASGYFAAGLGATTLSPTFAGVSASSDTRFTTNFGFGGKFSLSPRVAIRIDGRWRWVDTDQTTGAGGWCDIYGYCYAYTTTWYASGEVTGGLTFRF